MSLKEQSSLNRDPSPPPVLPPVPVTPVISQERRSLPTPVISQDLKPLPISRASAPKPSPPIEKPSSYDQERMSRVLTQGDIVGRGVAPSHRVETARKLKQHKPKEEIHDPFPLPPPAPIIDHTHDDLFHTAPLHHDYNDHEHGHDEDHGQWALPHMSIVSEKPHHEGAFGGEGIISRINRMSEDLDVLKNENRKLQV